jgi:hypothetical protein
MIIMPQIKQEKEHGFRVESNGKLAHAGAPLHNISYLEGPA